MPDRVPDAPRSADVDFVAFYEQEYTATVRLAAFLSSDRTIAEDLAQEAFSRLHPRFDSLENPGGYIRTTLVNLCHNQRRSSRRESARHSRLGSNSATVSDRAAELDATLHRLSYEERAVVVLRYWLGLSEAEIADHLDCRPGTVKSRHARALKKIRKDLS